ncbi:MAG: radical SAM protein [Mediterranea sp.]|jgi:radical SAM protein with 4Fe4S-binding SPASM domain|nr:radical SAM protein [Mediterranea sp.]
MNIVVNSQYFIRNEKKCSYIIYVGDYALAKAGGFSWVNPIPPFMGFLLSLFNGEEFDSSIKRGSEMLNISEDKVCSLVNKLINNEYSYMSSFKGVKFSFPAKLLIESTDESKTYTAIDANPFDEFVIHRLSVPAYLNIMITSKCGTNCVYCYADRSRKDDMSTDIIVNLIKGAKEQGVAGILISGGDVFAHAEWRSILKTLCDTGNIPFLSTKIPLDESAIFYLKEIGLEMIQYSIDSFEPSMVKRNLRISSAEDYVTKLMDTLLFCDRLGLSINVKTVLTKHNSTLGNMEEIFHLLSKHNSVTSWNIVPAFCSTYKPDYEEYKPREEALLTIAGYLATLKSHFQISMESVKKKSSPFKRFEAVDDFVKKNKGCGANTYSMCVFSNGKVSVCEMLYYNDLFYIGDVNISSIREIWNSEKALALYSFKHVGPKNEESPCYECKVQSTCRKQPLRKICYADIVKLYGKDKWDYPDPRCPQAPNCDLGKIM